VKPHDVPIPVGSLGLRWGNPQELKSKKAEESQSKAKLVPHLVEKMADFAFKQLISVSCSTV